MPADAQAPKVATASSGMVLAVQNKQMCFVVLGLITSTWVKPYPNQIKM